MYHAMKHVHDIHMQAKTYIPVIQNLELTVSNCHVRIEDTTVNTPVPLAFGIIVKTASVMPGGKGGKQEDDSSQQQWGGIGPEAKSDPTLVDKVVQAEHVGIYADGDNILSLMTEEVGPDQAAFMTVYQCSV